MYGRLLVVFCKTEPTFLHLSNGLTNWRTTVTGKASHHSCGPRMLGRKASDEFAVPLCRIHHRLVRRVGNEAAWWKDAGIDPIKAARKLWKQTRIDEGRTASEPRAERALQTGPPYRTVLSRTAKSQPDERRDAHHDTIEASGELFHTPDGAAFTHLDIGHRRTVHQGIDRFTQLEGRPATRMGFQLRSNFWSTQSPRFRACPGLVYPPGSGLY